ncbi:crocetin glucosyltransferase 2-like [Hordeum vulgare]|nr:crocetin glucosyltransferase 2-like [Hordeum vulgare]
MLQLGRRLAYHGLCPRLITTHHLLATVPPPLPPFRAASTSDSFDDGGMVACPDFREYVHRLVAAGSETLEALFLFEPGERRPPCAVDVVYGEVYAGRGQERAPGPAERRLGAGGRAVVRGGAGVVPCVTEHGGRAVRWLEDADDVFVNFFHELETKEADYLASTWRVKTIDPTLSSFYLDDDRLPSNKTYGFDLFDDTTPCMAWLDRQPPSSVVYASYGTVADLNQVQLEEIGHGLCNSGKQFLWVVRSVDEHKLSQQLHDKCRVISIVVLSN